MAESATTIDTATISAKLKRFTNDVRYLQAIKYDLLSKYPEQWIAIFDGQLVGTAAELGDLIKELDRKGIDSGEAAVEFLTLKRKALIL